MSYAPVINLDTARRRLIATRLLNLGVPLTTITATRNDTELADLWTRERTLRNLAQLTGYHRTFFDVWDTDDLLELERTAYRQLMSHDRAWETRLTRSVTGHNNAA